MPHPFRTIEETHNALKNRTLTVRALVDEYLAVIAEKNSDINAYLEVFTDIDEQVSRAQTMFDNGTATMLTGIPVAMKDNMLIKGHVASASSKMLESYVASYDGTVARILKEHGAILIGRTNMDEFAMGSSTENSAFGRTKNPLDTSRVPGGSSGGAAAALAMGGALISLGSDTGGSIRQPAAFCDLVGMKPTYGTISRHGLIAMASSLDQIGPMTHTVRDAEILFEALSVHDPMEATSVPVEKRISTHTEKKKIGVPRKMISQEGLDPEILSVFESSLEKLKVQGYEIVDVDMPLSEHALAVYYILQPAEVSSNLARFDGIRFGLSEEGTTLLDVYEKSRGKGFGKEVRRRMILGAYILSHGYYDAYYAKALAVRSMIEKEFETLFEQVDMIATPTSPFLPFVAGEKVADPLAMYMSDFFAVPANIAGIPAISLPAGHAKNGLPIGLQLMAPLFEDKMLFTCGKTFLGE